MTSRSPFIGRMNTPGGSPNTIAAQMSAAPPAAQAHGWAGPGATQPPSSNYPAWQGPSNFSNHISSPYTAAGPPFIPNMTPAVGANASLPYNPYFPPTPPNPGAPPPSQPPPGVSNDYTGYPSYSQASPWAQPPNLGGQSTTPWSGPGGMPLPGTNSTPWGGPTGLPAPWGPQGGGGGPPGGGFPRPFPGVGGGGGGGFPGPANPIMNGHLGGPMGGMGGMGGHHQSPWAPSQNINPMMGGPGPSNITGPMGPPPFGPPPGPGGGGLGGGFDNWGLSSPSSWGFGGGQPGGGFGGGQPGGGFGGGQPGGGFGGGQPGGGFGGGQPGGGFGGMFGQPVPSSMHHRGERGDAVSHWLPGPGYGPVLDPILVTVLGVSLQINPLLHPPPNSMDSSERPWLRWNMLFPPNHISRSDDQDPRMSWIKGRDEPATFPRVSFLRLACACLLQMINIHASNPQLGVTCGDVINGIHENLMRPSGGAEFHAVPPAKQRALGERYKHNRSREHGVPGGSLGEGMRRLDWLEQNTMFGGIVLNDGLVQQICGRAMPCTLELKADERFAMNEREITEQQLRQRTILEERAREEANSSGRRSRPRSTTVETVSDVDGERRG